MELLVSHSLMAQVDMSYRIHLLIGVVHIIEMVNEPGIAIDIRVLDGYSLTTLQGEDKVFRVEHVQHGEDAVAIHLCHVSTSL